MHCPKFYVEFWLKYAVVNFNFCFKGIVVLEGYWRRLFLFYFQYRISNIHYNVTSGERYPVPDKSAPVYITVGDGGNQEGLAGRWVELHDLVNLFSLINFLKYSRQIKESSSTCMRNFKSFPVVHNNCWSCRFIDPQPNYSAFREASYGHSTLEIKNRTHAFYHWNRNDDGKKVATDSFILHNQYWWVKHSLLSPSGENHHSYFGTTKT